MFNHIMSASQSSNLLLSVTLLFTFQMLSSTHAASITCNTPLGVQGHSWEVQLSSSIFLLRLQFHTVLALGNILAINTRVEQLKLIQSSTVLHHKIYSFKVGEKISSYYSRDYAHLGFGALRRVNGLGLVELRFLLTLGDAVSQ